MRSLFPKPPEIKPPASEATGCAVLKPSTKIEDQTLKLQKFTLAEVGQITLALTHVYTYPPRASTVVQTDALLPWHVDQS